MKVKDNTCKLGSRLSRVGVSALAFVLMAVLHGDLSAGNRKPCNNTARAAHRACRNDARDDYWITIGNCYNIADYDEMEECFDDAAEEFYEAKELCGEQLDARRDVCKRLGQGVHDPEIDPDDFVDFEEVIEEGEEFTPNPYFSLVPGTIREYLVMEADGEVVERVLVEILAETKEILDVNCIVVRDRVWEVDEDGEEELVEDTFDWLAQHEETGDVWYFGENAKDFEDGLIDSLDGSFEAGKEFAKPGFWVLADPEAGDFYRQEFALGEAEDVAEVVSVGEESVTVPVGTFDEGVLKTRDASPLEPGNFEFKFYAPGVGLISETNPESGERLVLIDRTDP